MWEGEIASEYKSFRKFVYDELETGSKRGFFRDEQGQNNITIKIESSNQTEFGLNAYFAIAYSIVLAGAYHSELPFPLLHNMESIINL